MIEHGYPDSVRDLLTFAKGIPVGKEKNNIPDYDVRPIITNSNGIRLADKCALTNILYKKRRLYMGPFQTIGIRGGIEKNILSVRTALSIVNKCEELAIINADCANFYNSIDRLKLFDFIKANIPEFFNYYKFMYGRANRIAFSTDHHILMNNGLQQGLSSSEFLASIASMPHVS